MGSGKNCFNWRSIQFVIPLLVQELIVTAAVSYGDSWKTLSYLKRNEGVYITGTEIITCLIPLSPFLSRFSAKVILLMRHAKVIFFHDALLFMCMFAIRR